MPGYGAGNVGQGGQQGGMPDWLAQALGIGGGFGTAAGGLFNLFGGGGKNPADTANKWLDQIPEAMRPYFQKYMDAGGGAMGDLQNQFGQLTNKTGDVYNRLAGGYKESPGYQFKLNQALGAGNNAVAAGGMLGTPAHQQQNMQLGNDIASQDFNDYLSKQMGLYGMGLQGQQGINQMGYDASTGYGSMLGDVLGQKGAYSFAGQAGKNKAKSGGMSDIFSGLGMGLGALFGGPAGAAAGGAGGSWLSKLFGH